MLRSNHIACTQAITTSIVIAHQLSPMIALPFLVGSYFGSDLPDIDHQYNQLHVTLHRLHLLPNNFKHRGITHTIWSVIGLCFLTYWSLRFHIPPNYHWITWGLLGLTIGYLIHLLIDSFSVQGINWIYPFHQQQPPKHRMRLAYRTGGTFELWFGIFMRICWYILSVHLLQFWF